MKQKYAINLSDEEIIDFIANLRNDPIHKDINFYNVAPTFFLVLVGISSLFAALIGPAIGLFTLSIDFFFSCGALLGLFAICSTPFYVLSAKNKREFLKLSNGKITYRKFKELKKNGVINEWCDKFSKEIELRSLEIRGITVEQYSKNTEDSILDDVKQKIANSSSVAKLDSERVAKEVKKIIDENNERQN